MWPRIECHGCRERCFCFGHDLSTRHLEINVKSINWILKEQKHLGAAGVRWLHSLQVHFYLQLPFLSVLSLYLCLREVYIRNHPSWTVLWPRSVQIACCEERIVSAGQARGHELRTEEREPDWEREGSLPCPISSPWWWGQEGTREGVGGGRWREAAILQSTVGVLLYLHTHQQNYRFMQRKHTLTHPVRTPLADYPPAEAFCKRVAWVNTAPLRARLWCKLLSVCVCVCVCVCVWAERERDRERERERERVR